MRNYLILTALFAAVAASGTTLTYNMTAEFSGGQAPGNPSPWVVLTLTDAGQPAGTVKLTVDNVGLKAAENMSGLYFNYSDPKDLTALSFSLGARVGTFDDPIFTALENGYKADGDGFFDILGSFTTGGTPSHVFAGGESLEILIHDSDNILAPADFAFLSLDAGGHGPFAAAAHIQNTTGAGSGGSGWIAGPVNLVPTPFSVPDSGSTLALAGLGLFGLALFRRR